MQIPYLLCSQTLVNDKLLIENASLFTSITETPRVEPPLPSKKVAGQTHRDTEMAALLRMLNQGSTRASAANAKALEALVGECVSLAAPALPASSRTNELRRMAAVRVHEALVRQASKPYY